MATPDKSTGLPGLTSSDCRQCQSDFDLEFYGQILQRSTDYVDVLRRQAELLANRGDYQRGLPMDRRLARLLPCDCVVHYNLACSLAMVGQSQEAVAALAKALELGYRDFAHLEADADLDALRDLPEFRALVQAHGIVA
jgi:Flp pilus assembly protein TadD